MIRPRLVSALLAAALAAAWASAGAGAQSLLDDILPQRGVCTCATIEPPNDCDAALAEPRAVAREQRGQIRGQCATDWRRACEEQYGWQACASQEANAQLASTCDEYAASWWNEIAAPQINQMAAQCNAANQSWIQQCETVERPQNCRACDDMDSEIAALERDIADTQAWLAAMRNGERLITPDDEEQIAQRVDQLDRWRRDLAEKRDGLSLLQSSEFCPRT